MKIGLPLFSKSKQSQEVAEEDAARRERIQAAIDRAIGSLQIEPPAPVVTEMQLRDADCAQTVAA